MPRIQRFKIFNPIKYLSAPVFGLYLKDSKTGKQEWVRQSPYGRLFRSDRWQPAGKSKGFDSKRVKFSRPKKGKKGKGKCGCK